MGRDNSAVLCALLLAGLLAVTSCGNVAAARREEADAHYRMANSFLQQGRGFHDETNRRRAYPETIKAISLAPGNANYHLLLGTLYLYNGEFIPAEKEIRKALEIDPGFGDAHNNLGLVYVEEGRLTKAAAEFRMAIDNHSYQSPEIASFNLGRANYLMGDYSGATGALERSLAILPNNEEARYLLGRSYVKLGRLGPAGKAFESALALNPESARSHYELGIVQFKQDRKEEAVRHFQEVLRIDPEGELAVQARTYLKLL
jgi:Tfp pilus assembly protein PilF